MSLFERVVNEAKEDVLVSKRVRGKVLKAVKIPGRHGTYTVVFSGSPTGKHSIFVDSPRTDWRAHWDGYLEVATGAIPKKAPKPQKLSKKADWIGLASAYYLSQNDRGPSPYVGGDFKAAVHNALNAAKANGDVLDLVADVMNSSYSNPKFSQEAYVDGINAWLEEAGKSRKSRTLPKKVIDLVMDAIDAGAFDAASFFYDIGGWAQM